MLVFDLKSIGNNLFNIRNRKLMSRAEVAEKAELSDRAYADIERGNVNMRLETLLNICRALNITPNDVLTIEDSSDFSEAQLPSLLNSCSSSEKHTALKLVKVYLDSVK